MKRIVIITFCLISLEIGLPAIRQEKQHFYNVDKEIKVEGTIEKIIMEPRYKDTAPFLIVALKEKKTQHLYQVEVSPVWFFDYDFHQGESLVITGSLYQTGENRFNLIAREIQFKGELFTLRDKHGFPNWRGGKSLQKKRGKGKGRGKGIRF